jgi:DNA-binding MurR/RpiR family transcriptional regulator
MRSLEETLRTLDTGESASFEAALPRDSLVSRISQMAVVDALCLGVLLEGYSRFRGRLAGVEQILADRLYAP